MCQQYCDHGNSKRERPIHREHPVYREHPIHREHPVHREQKLADGREYMAQGLTTDSTGDSFHIFVYYVFGCLGSLACER